MKKKTSRHYAHVAHTLHHHYGHKHLPKVFYHRESFFSIILGRSLVLLFILGSLGYFLVNNLAPEVTNPITSAPQKIVFSLEGSPEDWGIDSTSLNTHGAAANEFDFLFTETGGTDQQMYSTTGASTDSSSEDEIISNPASGQTTLPLETGLPIQNVSENISGVVNTNIDQNLALNIELVQSLIQTSAVSSDQTISLGASNTGASDISLELIDSDSNSTSSSLLPIEASASCKTPWGEIIPHKDFILAYKQRTDVNSLCNVQKRYCFNGKLTGSYTQNSCKEDLKYTYQEVVTVAQNDPTIEDPLIQPNSPSLRGADFDVHGKIQSTSQATDDWSNSGKPLVESTGSYVQHISSTSSSCITPWGENLVNGQFVKAYKSPVGLIDMPCQVEIRLCSTAGLKGSFHYSTCLAKNMTYSDYVLDKGENSDKPNTTDMMNSVMTDSQKNSSPTPGFWSWLTKHL